MSPFWSRDRHRARALPVVLGAVYLGGWWLFALVAFGAAVALHEFWLLARPLAPLSLAGYIGAGARAASAPSSRGSTG